MKNINFLLLLLLLLLILFSILSLIFLKTNENKKPILEGLSNNPENPNLKCSKYPYLCSNKTRNQLNREYKIEASKYNFISHNPIPETYYWASKT